RLLKRLRAEDFQAGHRRNLVDLIVDVADQLPRDQSFEEACGVVKSVGEGRRESFSVAVAKLYGFVGQLKQSPPSPHCAPSPAARTIEKPKPPPPAHPALP